MSNELFPLALLQMLDVGRKTALSLIRRFPTADDLVSAEMPIRIGRRRVSSGEVKAELSLAFDKAHELVKHHSAQGVTILLCNAPSFPKSLLAIPDPPVALYVRGSVSSLSRAGVAVVGTREPTDLALQAARRISRVLVSGDYVVVSGLARGIDVEAHRATLRAGGTGVAVLPGGLDQVHPKEGASLAVDLLEAGGTLVSEYPLGTRPQRSYFVDRDRIQSGLSIAVVPVQMQIDSGTMHTVRFAEAQDRLVMCETPSRREANSPQNQGVMELIRTGRAFSFKHRDHDELLRQLRKFRAPWEREQTTAAGTDGRTMRLFN